MAVAITTVTYYLIYDVFEAVFAVKALEEQLSFIELEINQISSANVLIWQSNVVAANLWPMSAQRDGDPPIKCLEFYQTVLILGATIGFPMYVYSQVWFLPTNSTICAYSLLLLDVIYIVVAITMCVWRGINSAFADGCGYENERWEGTE